MWPSSSGCEFIGLSLAFSFFLFFSLCVFAILKSAVQPKGLEGSLHTSTCGLLVLGVSSLVFPLLSLSFFSSLFVSLQFSSRPYSRKDWKEVYTHPHVAF